MREWLPESSKTRRALAVIMLASISSGLMGCLGLGGTRHMAVPTGTTGVSLGPGRAAFPDEKGTLIPGKYKEQAGDLIRRPKDQQEVLDALKAAGAKFEEKKSGEGPGVPAR